MVAARHPGHYGGDGRDVLRDAGVLLFLAGAAVLVTGARHFGNGWPGTGGHLWAHQDLVPAGVAAFGWASTLSVSSYWAHPAALLAFPADEIAWMALSPLAMASAVTGAARIVRRLDLPPRVLQHEVRLASAAALAMAVFLAGSFAWISYGGPGPRNLFHAGIIEVAGFLVMATALAVAGRAGRAARAALAYPAR
jgi:hypothetical protein